MNYRFQSMNQSGKPSEPLSKSRLKLIYSLQYKKNRALEQLYVVEGEKIVREYMEAAGNRICTIRFLVSTAGWADRNREDLKKIGTQLFSVDYRDIERISGLKTPQEVMAVVEMNRPVYSPEILKGKVTLSLESIRDPGNLGTIIRTADWFGLDNILCSPDSVDLFNPKVIQSAMGSTLRVRVFYHSLKMVLKDAGSLNIPVYGTFTRGTPLYRLSFPDEMVVLFGNESAGIEAGLLPLITESIMIPAYPEGKKRAESLNVASAVAVIMSELRRQKRGPDYSK
ncbi:MAG: RNA methyltransferase [Bacteroidales bacterium]|nr:RNA methyltransferase [Bacteroidales bacterium]MBN2697760.1 RNA methyltransferase [Bacteroidales bacterium]